MKMVRSNMTFLLVVAFSSFPAHVVGGGLRGLMVESLQPLQRPPPILAQMEFQDYGAAPAAAPGGSPAAAPGAAGPAPAVAMPALPKMPPITAATCKALNGKVAKLIGGTASGGGPAPAPGASLLQGAAPAASPAGAKGPKPTVECKIYAFVSGKGAGCTCFLEALSPAKVGGCPQVPGALDMGFTGSVVEEASMAFGGQTGGWTRHTCTYRQWFFDPKAVGPALKYQTMLNNARAEKYIKETYAAALNNAHNTAKAFWPLTAVPWLKLYPTTPWPVAAAGPAPGPAMPSTTPPILFAPTTPMFGMTTARPWGAAPAAAPWGMPTTPRPWGMPTTPAAFGAATTAPTFAVRR